MRNNPYYKIALWIVLLASFFVLIKLNSVLIKPEYIPVDDFVRHWASGKLLLSGGDPYAIDSIQILQDQATGSEARSEVINTIYIPPWSLFILAPFAAFDYPASRLLWLLFSIVILLISAELLWKTYNGTPTKKWLSWIIVFTFSPTISVLEKGQTGSLVLLGLAGFLYFQKQRPNQRANQRAYQRAYWLAGMFAALISIKPQLVFLFWPALLFWSIKRREFTILLSCGATVLVTSLIAVLLDPNVFLDYLNNVRFSSPLEWATPSIGGYLRYFIVGVDYFWPQYIGPLIGLIFFVVYWIKERNSWQWDHTSPWLILVSVITSFYSWTYDQVVMLPAILQAWIRLPQLKKSIAWGLGIAFFIIQLLNLLLHRYFDDFWFIWLAPAHLIWYVAVFLLKEDHHAHR